MRVRSSRVAAATVLAVVSLTTAHPASAASASDVVADLERAFATGDCPTAATRVALAASPDEDVNAGSVVLAAVDTGSPLVDRLRTAYWTTRSGAPGDPASFGLVDLAECFLGIDFGSDRARYATGLSQAARGMAAADRTIQRIASPGGAEVDGTTYTVTDLPGPVGVLASTVVGDTSDAGLALVLAMLAADVPMLQNMTLGPQGTTGPEEAEQAAVNDLHLVVDEAVTQAVAPIPLDTIPWPRPRPKCKFRQTQPGDIDSGFGEHVFVATASTFPWGERDMYQLTTPASTYMYNEPARCVKFGSMNGSYRFDDLTPSPDNLACEWRVLEPYGYVTYYEFLKGYPNSGWMLRNIYQLALTCDAVLVPFLKVDTDKDCAYNNLYVHYDDGVSWYYGSDSDHCHAEPL